MAASASRAIWGSDIRPEGRGGEGTWLCQSFVTNGEGGKESQTTGKEHVPGPKKARRGGEPLYVLNRQD